MDHYCEVYMNREQLALCNRGTQLHSDRFDPDSLIWQRVLEVVEEAVNDGREVFNPLESLGWEVWSQVITLPSTIKKMKSVKKLYIMGSSLLSLPPEIGEMDSLEEFDAYMSYGLHWYPYEITRCRRLKDSKASTRALYGMKSRAPLPVLNTPDILDFINPKACSICGTEITKETVIQAWYIKRVATDTLPLMVNACSQSCIDSLRSAQDGRLIEQALS